MIINNTLILNKMEYMNEPFNTDSFLNADDIGDNFKKNYTCSRCAPKFEIPKWQTRKINNVYKNNKNIPNYLMCNINKFVLCLNTSINLYSNKPSSINQNLIPSIQNNDNNLILYCHNLDKLKLVISLFRMDQITLFSDDRFFGIQILFYLERATHLPLSNIQNTDNSHFTE